MRSNISSQIAPSWGTQSTWKEANRSIDNLFQRHAGKLRSAVTLASVVRVRLESIFYILDDICIETCPRCPDPCCLHEIKTFRKAMEETFIRVTA